MYGEILDTFITKGSWYGPLTVIIVTILLVRLHPEPADACCKCFEDGVAFAGVFIGVKFGQWRDPSMRNITEGLDSTHVTIFLLKAAVKLVLGINNSNRLLRYLGVSILFAWRATTKPLLHRILPPFYRLLEKARLDMPRRYFMRASLTSSRGLG